MSSALRWWVSGRVQGVSFRAATRDKALAPGLNGYARNLADGRVEVYACGSGPALRDLGIWLQRGPPAARVERAMQAAAVDEGVSGFEIRR